MWPFSARNPRVETEEIVSNETNPFDFAPYATNDAYIKLWLSDKLNNAIDIVGVQHSISRPDVLRWILFEHVYGRQLFVELVQYKDALDTAKPVPKFCRKPVPQTERAVNQQYLGKATDNIKLWLPTPLKTNLVSLAEQQNLALSNYLRSMLVSHLFGHQFYQQWQEALEVINQEALIHEEEN